jgi:hypothetical protein
MSDEQSLVDDLATVLVHMVVGWKDLIGHDLAEHPEVQRVMARYRERPLEGAFGPQYRKGMVSFDMESLNFAIDGDSTRLQDCTFGVQVHHDGRVWVCVNAVTFLRFKPA